MWENIKNFFRFLDLNRDNKVNAQDVVFAELKIKDANELINDQITDSVTAVEKRVQRIKEELVDVKNATKEVIDQTGDVADAVKGKKRSGRKKVTNK